MITMTLPQYRRRECIIDGRKVRLVPMVCKTLAVLLVAGPDRFVGRMELMEALWPNPRFRPAYAPKIVDIYIFRLRRHGVAIKTCWGVGWQIPRFAREAAPERLAA